MTGALAAEQEAERLGCQLNAEWDNGTWDVALWAPPGMLFGDTGSHCYCTLAANGKTNRDFDWAESVNQMRKAGGELVECDDPECEICHPELH